MREDPSVPALGPYVAYMEPRCKEAADGDSDNMLVPCTIQVRPLWLATLQIDMRCRSDKTRGACGRPV